MHPHPTDIVPNLFGAHRMQDELVMALRAALVGGQLGRARDLLRRVDGKLRRHFFYEETLLLPPYEERLDSDAARGAAELICVEHRWVEGLLDRAAGLSADLGGEGGAPVDGVLELADVIARVEHILEHHDRREDDAFNPVLDDILELDERKTILGTIASMEIAALREELSVEAGAELLPTQRLADLEVTEEPRGTEVTAILDACRGRVRALRYMLATDDTGRMPRVIQAIRALLDQLERATMPLVDVAAEERFRKLVVGQHAKMQMLLGRCSVKVAEGLAKRGEARWEVFVRAYDAASTLSGLLDNHATAVTLQLEAASAAPRGYAAV